MAIRQAKRIGHQTGLPIYGNSPVIGRADGLPIGLEFGGSLTDYLKGQPSLVAGYQFNEFSGNLINFAATGSVLDGVPTSVTQGVATTLGKVPLAYSFDGVDDLITISNDAALANLTNQTWGFLVKFVSDGEGGVGRVMNWGNSNSYLRTSGADRYRFQLDYDTTDLVAQPATNTIAVGSWNWVFAGHDAATKRGKVYQGINGVLAEFALSTDTAGDASLVTPVDDLIIGNQAAAGATMDGDMAYAFVLDVAPDTVEDVLQRVVTLSGV